MSAISKTGRVILRVAGGIIGIGVILMGILVLSRLAVYAPQAEAASPTYHPNFCLGGWKYAQHASGPDAIPLHSDPSEYTLQNSAYLASSVASDLYCGYFPVKDSKNPPARVTIAFNWSFTSVNQVSPVEQSYTSTSSESSVISPETGFTAIMPTSTDHTSGESQPVVIPVAPTIPEGQSLVPEAPVTPLPSSETPPVSPTQGSSETQPGTSGTDAAPVVDSAASTQTPAAPVSTPAVESTPAPAATPAAAPESTPAPAADAPQAFNFMKSSWDFLSSLVAEQAHAEVLVATSTMTSLDDIFEVSYSTDGINWVPLGKVNKANRDNFSVQVPIKSWDELKRLQILVSVLPSIVEKPDVYLESMSLTAQYKRTLTEVASASLAAVSDAIDSLIDSPDDEPVVEVVEEAATSTPKIKAVQYNIKTTRELLFTTGQGKIATKTILPWYDNEFLTKIGKIDNSGKDIDVEKASDLQSLLVKGTCSKAFYVILLFKSAEDYIDHPGAAINNSAHICEGGAFTYDLKRLPSDIPAGSYYLLAAEEDTTGPWVPSSSLVPITIDATTTTITTIQE